MLSPSASAAASRSTFTSSLNLLDLSLAQPHLCAFTPRQLAPFSSSHVFRRSLPRSLAPFRKEQLAEQATCSSRSTFLPLFPQRVRGLSNHPIAGRSAGPLRAGSEVFLRRRVGLSSSSSFCCLTACCSSRTDACGLDRMVRLPGLVVLALSLSLPSSPVLALPTAAPTAGASSLSTAAAAGDVLTRSSGREVARRDGEKTSESLERRAAGASYYSSLVAFGASYTGALTIPPSTACIGGCATPTNRSLTSRPSSLPFPFTRRFRQTTHTLVHPNMPAHFGSTSRTASTEGGTRMDRSRSSTWSRLRRSRRCRRMGRGSSCWTVRGGFPCQ